MRFWETAISVDQEDLEAAMSFLCAGRLHLLPAGQTRSSVGVANQLRCSFSEAVITEWGQVLT